MYPSNPLRIPGTEIRRTLNSAARPAAGVLLGLLLLLTLGSTPPCAGADVFKEVDIGDAPTIRLNYGLATGSFEDLRGSFADVGVAELCLGFTGLGESADRILDYRYHDISFANLSSELKSTSSEDDAVDANEIDAEIWRIGFNEATGYGYRVRRSAIIPYSGWGLEASRLTVDEPVVDHDRELIDLYHNDFRFGTKMEGGLRLQLGPTLELGAGYERGIVFRRWLVWKWMLSGLLEHTSQAILDEFIGEIRKRSPGAAPIVHFVLKNALSYAWYELRRDEMNYPLDSEAPILIETYKVGISFVF